MTRNGVFCLFDLSVNRSVGRSAGRSLFSAKPGMWFLEVWGVASQSVLGTGGKTEIPDTVFQLVGCSRRVLSLLYQVTIMVVLLVLNEPTSILECTSGAAMPLFFLFFVFSVFLFD